MAGPITWQWDLAFTAFSWVALHARQAVVGAAVSHLPGDVRCVAVDNRRQGVEWVEPFVLQSGSEPRQPVPFRPMAAHRLIEIPGPDRSGCCGQDMLDGIAHQRGAVAVTFRGPDLGVIFPQRPGSGEQDLVRGKRLYEMDTQRRAHFEPDVG